MTGNRANCDKTACFGMVSGKIKVIGKVGMLKRLKTAPGWLKIEKG